MQPGHFKLVRNLTVKGEESEERGREFALAWKQAESSDL
jgi:hypothetical protein